MPTYKAPEDNTVHGKKVTLLLARRVKQLREEIGYTQEKLADLTGIDYKYLQKIEGKNPPFIRVDTSANSPKHLKQPAHR